MFLIRVFFLVVLFAAPALADCTNPAGTEGKMVYNADYNLPQICDGTNWLALGFLNPGAGGSGCTNPAGTEGQIIYNSDFHIPQYCDGENWVEMTGTVPGCRPPALCPNIGDICDDGNAVNDPDQVFAGFIFYDGYRCEALFTTQNDKPGSSQWKNATGTDDITNDSLIDGKINDSQIPDSWDFPAFKYCKNLTEGGYDDWYLGAVAEVSLLYRNREAIGNFSTQYTWTSSEASVDNPFGVAFLTGTQNNPSSKTNKHYLRCVRRD